MENTTGDCVAQPSGDAGPDRRVLLGAGLAGLAGLAALARPVRAGPLDPPAGPVSSTGRTLQEIYERTARTAAGIAEPRIPVQSLPGSATGLFVISQPGSYYLTGNITGSAAKNSIEVDADNVSIDLCGYAIAGVQGSLRGIDAAPGTTGLRVHNGSIVGGNDVGIFARESSCSSVHHITFEGINERAVWVHEGSAVWECVARQCGGRAISIEARSAAWRCVADACGSPAFFGQNNVSILECEASNSGEGMVIEGGGRICRCHAFACGNGIVAPFGETLISENFVRDCGTGIVAGGGCEVAGNCVIGCSGAGFQIGGMNNLVIQNRSRRNGSAFSIAPGSAHGPIVTVAGAGAITSVPNADHPWANFVF